MLSCTISLYLKLFDLTPNHPPEMDASPFRRLPAELRNVIFFEQALHKPNGINMLTAQWHKPTAAYALCMALTRTGREIRADTLAMFYAIVEFMFQVGTLGHLDPLGLIRSIKVWLDKNINHIATLHIKLEDFCWVPNGGLSEDWQNLHSIISHYSLPKTKLRVSSMVLPVNNAMVGTYATFSFPLGDREVARQCIEVEWERRRQAAREARLEAHVGVGEWPAAARESRSRHNKVVRIVLDAKYWTSGPAR